MKKILFATILFGLLSCEKEVSIEDQIVGTWYMPQSLNRYTAGRSVEDVAGHSLNAWNYAMVITTNSNQELIDRMADGQGSIDVSGIVEDEIKFMHGWTDPYSGESSVSITNYNWFKNQEGSDKPFITAYMNNYSNNYQDTTIWYDDSTGNYDTTVWWNSDYIGVYFNDGDYIEIQDHIDFTFDGRILNIPEQQYSVSDTNFLMIGGTLEHSTIAIPANTPTEIFSYEDDTSWDYGSWAIHIEDKGRWVEVYTWEDPYDDGSGWDRTYTDSTVAEWELDGDTLYVKYRYDDIWVDSGDGPGIGQGTWIYEVAYTYEINNGSLVLTNEFDICQDELFCKEWLEWEYGLDQGSLEEFKMVWALEFTKTPGARSREFRGPFRTVIGKFPPYKFMK